MFSLFRKSVGPQDVSPCESPATSDQSLAGDVPTAESAEASNAMPAPSIHDELGPIEATSAPLASVPLDGSVAAASHLSAAQEAHCESTGAPCAPAASPNADAIAGISDDAPVSAHKVMSSSGVTAAPDTTSEASPDAQGTWLDELPSELRATRSRQRGKRLEKPGASQEKRSFTPQQRLLLLDSWRRSGLPAKDFAALVGIAKHTLYKWNEQFNMFGPEGLMEQPHAVRNHGRIPEVTKRAILMLKESHPEWGCQRISDMLLRGPALPASASSVARVLHEAGYELVDDPTRPHPEPERRFERARPNQLWQTDLFTFMLKRQNRRVYLVAFLDDHSRFVVSYGLHATSSTALVLEVLEAGIGSYGPPEEILTDNGPQYVTWRGKSQFTRRLEQLGIRQIVARPKRPQTLGKIERFWGTLWREFLEVAVFSDLAEARTRIGLFIDYYNFQRVHRGIEGLVPADRFFGAASEVVKTLKQRVAANALDLARHGQVRPPFYVTGQMEGEAFSLHAEGPRLILTRPGQPRQEVELVRPGDTPASGDDSTASALPHPICPDGSPREDNVSVQDVAIEETGEGEAGGEV